MTCLTSPSPTLYKMGRQKRLKPRGILNAPAKEIDGNVNLTDGEAAVLLLFEK
jgi:hypothetical protein